MKNKVNVLIWSAIVWGILFCIATLEHWAIARVLLPIVGIILIGFLVWATVFALKNVENTDETKKTKKKESK